MLSQFVFVLKIKIKRAFSLLVNMKGHEEARGGRGRATGQSVGAPNPKASPRGGVPLRPGLNTMSPGVKAFAGSGPSRK